MPEPGVVDAYLDGQTDLFSDKLFDAIRLGVDLGAIKLVNAARHWICRVTGYPIKRGIYVDACYDIGHIENVHFWPFGVSYDPNNPYCKWVNMEGVAFELARTDWHYIFNTFCFGYGVGYKFSASAQGSANGNFLGLGADSCQRAVVVEQAQPPGLLISRRSSNCRTSMRRPVSR